MIGGAETLWLRSLRGSSSAQGPVPGLPVSVPGPPDAGPGSPDAGPGPPDTGTGPPDAGAAPRDAGTGLPDAGTGRPDEAAGGKVIIAASGSIATAVLLCDIFLCNNSFNWAEGAAAIAATAAAFPEE